MEITLNLASPAMRRRRHLYRLAVAGLCLNILLGVGNVLLFRASQAELRVTEERLREYRAAVEEGERLLAALPRRLSTAELERFGGRIALYNRIIQGANFSFTRLLFELERGVPANVTLTEIQPDLGAGGVTLSGMAKTMEDLLRCVEHLKEREAFQQVYLLNHAVERGTGALQFTISLRVRGETA